MLTYVRKCVTDFRTASRVRVASKMSEKKTNLFGVLRKPAQPPGGQNHELQLVTTAKLSGARMDFVKH